MIQGEPDSQRAITLRAASGRLVSAGWRWDPPNIADVPLSGDPRGRLYILLELAGNPRRLGEFERSLLKRIVDEFASIPGGISNSLRRTIRAAAAALYEENQRQPEAPLPWAAGVCCAAIREADFYLSQGGPALAVLLRAEALRTFPADVNWGRLRGGPAAPLGSEGPSKVGTPEIYHLRLEPGDRLLLASPILAEALTAAEVQAALAEPQPRSALESLHRAMRDQEFSALVLYSEAVPLEAERPTRVVEPLGAERGRGVNIIRWWRQSGLGESLAQTIRYALGQFGRGLSACGGLLRQMLPERSGPSGARPFARRRAASEREPIQRPRDLRGALLLGLLLLIGLGLALGGLSWWNAQQEARQREERYQELLSEVRTRIEAARDSSDAAFGRGTLAEAQALLQQAAQLAPDRPELATLSEEILTQMDALSGVFRLDSLRVALELTTPPDAPARIVLQGGDLYLFDGSDDRLYAYRWAADAKALQAPPQGSIVIEAGARGELRDIAWVEEGGERRVGALFVLGQDGLWEYRPTTGLVDVPIVDRELWSDPQRSGGFAGNYYVLDPVAQSIFKYLPTEASYTFPALQYLDPTEPVDMSGALDMAIDGSIYVLGRDGSLRKFDLGRPSRFRVQGLEVELLEPTALFTDARTAFLYVADPAHRRIVQLDKEGRFVRQLLPPRGQEEAFADLRTLWVDEPSGTLFVLSGPRLYLADLPPP